MQRYRIVKPSGILLDILTKQDTEMYCVRNKDILYLEVEDDDLWVIVKDGSRHLTADHAKIYISEGWIVPINSNSKREGQNDQVT